MQGAGSVFGGGQLVGWGPETLCTGVMRLPPITSSQGHPRLNPLLFQERLMLLMVLVLMLIFLLGKTSPRVTWVFGGNSGNIWLEKLFI